MASCDKHKSYIKLANERNYAVWKFQTTITLKKNDLYEYVDGSVEEPEEPEETASSAVKKKYDKDLKTFISKDNAAKDLLQLDLS